MIKDLKYIIKKIFFIIIFFQYEYLHADNFNLNLYNNHGVVGLINMPTARFYDEGVHGFILYDGTPDQKMTISSSPYDWLEASIYYTNVENRRYCPFEEYDFCKQDLKDKGFNVKIRLKEEGIFPAIAVGLYDFAGTGLYSSEYIVGSYGINNFDFHLGLGWGQLDGSDRKINNPLGYLSNRFNTRKLDTGSGGNFDLNKYFTSKKISPFFGISYSPRENLLLKIERDTIDTYDPHPELVYEQRKSDFSIGLDYSFNPNFVLGASYERGNYFSVRFIYKNNPKESVKKYTYQMSENIEEEDNKYTKLIKNLENNGIGVSKISETSQSIGLELTQFIHSDLRLIEEIISEATIDAGIRKNIKKDIKIADLEAYKEIDDSFKRNSNLIYERKPSKKFESSTNLKFRPFLASREEFFKGALLLENDSELVIRENLFFKSNLKYSIVDNFDDLRFPPQDTFPAQVRSDVKQYLKNMDGLMIGRAQMDYHVTPKKNHHIMLTGGILEDMFSGFGMEYLYFKQNTNYAFGIEVFNVKKRDYEWGFGHLDYTNTILTTNFYYRNYGRIPFDAKFSAGEYLAGDVGSTIELSRTLENGVSFGAFMTLTDVSKREFGEGSFDKGIFFNIPIYGDFINYTWRPLTKDPGAKLTRRNTLHELLVRFQPIN